MANCCKFSCKSSGVKAFLAIVFLLVFSLSGLSAMAQQDVADIPATQNVIDMRGRSVAVPDKIDRVIALGAGSLRLLTYSNAADKVIAVEDSGHGREKSVHDFFNLATYRLAFPELRNLPSIGSLENHEGIIAAAPDMIVTSYADLGQLDQLQSVLGIPVFAVDIDVEFYDKARFYQELSVLGGILDKKERAAELINGIEAVLNDLEKRSAKLDTPEKAYAGGMMYYGPADLLRTTGDYLPFDLTGTLNTMPSNPAGNRQPYITSLEDLIVAAPDYVFIDAANLPLSKSGFQKNRDLLVEQVPAFTEGRVYSTLVYKYYGTNWENQLINIYFVGKTLYPEIYGDVVIEEKAQEIWQLFFDAPLDYHAVIDLQRAGPGRVDWF